ncbi:15032_t:CDS:2 [Dentiscutata erythropus]|uniref:15032_t:CDS:1 n=1 Tax=Dentiscutata erythropus TaxID=1348616 RepID=A0A9N8WIA7_9GLOM|nr:15032_t:CDS:2 [Dentiscutata erythropus]
MDTISEVYIVDPLSTYPQEIKYMRSLFKKAIEDLSIHFSEYKNSPSITLAFPIIIESNEDDESKKEDKKIIDFSSYCKN